MNIVCKLTQTDSKIRHSWDNQNFGHQIFYIKGQWSVFLGLKDILVIFVCKQSLSFRATLSNIIDEIIISRICLQTIWDR